jgi:hypothetical protein
MDKNGIGKSVPANAAGPTGAPPVGMPVPAAQGEVHHHYYYEPDPKKRKRSMKPGIAGALLILTAVLGLIMGGMFVGGGFFFNNIEDGSDFWGIEDNGDIKGRITYLNGGGVENATVTVVGEGITTVTDENGHYILYNVPNGEQKLRVEKEDHNTYIMQIFVTPGESGWGSDNGDFDYEDVYNLEITKGTQVVERNEQPSRGIIGGMIYACGALFIVFSVLALLGGYFALKRKNFKLAAIGATMGIFTVFGTIFSLIALFLILISRDEFN